MADEAAAEGGDHEAGADGNEVALAESHGGNEDGGAAGDGAGGETETKAAGGIGAYRGGGTGAEQPEETLDDILNEGPQDITRATYVQPKKILDDIAPDGRYEAVKVQNAFKAANYVGIRSLPNALQPDFRKQLFEDILAKGKRLERGGGALAIVGRTGAGGIDGKPSADSLPAAAKGQRRPGEFAPGPKMFTSYEWMEDEYDAEKVERARLARESKEKWVEQGSDFVVTALPPIPKNTGAFNEFEYELDPFETKEEVAALEKQMELSKRLHGPYRVPGHMEKGEQNRLRTGDCLKMLEEVLSTDWSGSFLRAFEDESGCLAICFNRDTIESEGDVTTYMNHMFRSNPVVAEYSLRKDANRWGIVEEQVQHVFFVFWPPWVHQRLVPQELLQTPMLEQKAMPGLREPALVSGRMPFGPTTTGGVAIPVHTRTFARSFKF